MENTHPAKLGIGSTLKAIVLWLIAFAVVILILAAFVRGIVWAVSILFPLAQFLSRLGTTLLILMLLPSAVFKGSRRFCGKGIVAVSYIWGIALWMHATLLLYEIWGTTGLVLGVILLGAGSVALLCLALLFYGQFVALGLVVLLLILIFSVRAFGFWVISKGHPIPLPVERWDEFVDDFPE